MTLLSLASSTVSRGDGVPAAESGSAETDRTAARGSASFLGAWLLKRKLTGHDSESNEKGRFIIKGKDPRYAGYGEWGRKPRGEQHPSVASAPKSVIRPACGDVQTSNTHGTNHDHSACGRFAGIFCISGSYASLRPFFSGFGASGELADLALPSNLLRRASI